MHNYAVRLTENGVDVDAICFDTFDYDHCSKVRWPLFLRKASFFITLLRFLKLEQHFLSFLQYHFLPRFIRHYDVVDLNAYYGDYTHIAKECIQCKKNYIVTLWGSDLMRADEGQLKKLKFGLDNCACIKLSDSLHEVLHNKFGEVYDTKCRITYFGNSDLEVIDSLGDLECLSIKKALFGENSNKIIVVCGYNAIESQNHEIIIEALSGADPKLTDRCLFVFPMTYGKTRKGYKEKIQSKLAQSGLPYIVLRDFLESKQLAALRKSSDIVINIQSTDAMSGSIQDHLFCGNVCIIGEWLHYKPYEDNSVFYLKCSMESLKSSFEDVCSNLEEYKQKCDQNHSKIGYLFSWSKTLDPIKKVYLSI